MSIAWDQLYKEHGEAPEVIPDQTYDMEVASVTFKPAASGKPMWNFRCVVQGGPYNGHTVFTRLVWSNDNSQAQQIFFRSMGALGLGKSFWDRRPSHEEIAEALKGKQFRGAVYTRTYEGQKSNDIKRFSPPGTGTTPSATGSAAPSPAPSPAPQSAPTPPPAAPAPAKATQTAPAPSPTPAAAPAPTPPPATAKQSEPVPPAPVEDESGYDAPAPPDSPF